MVPQAIVTRVLNGHAHIVVLSAQLHEAADLEIGCGLAVVVDFDHGTRPKSPHDGRNASGHFQRQGLVGVGHRHGQALVMPLGVEQIILTGEDQGPCAQGLQLLTQGSSFVQITLATGDHEDRFRRIEQGVGRRHDGPIHRLGPVMVWRQLQHFTHQRAHQRRPQAGAVLGNHTRPDFGQLMAVQPRRRGTQHHIHPIVQRLGGDEGSDVHRPQHTVNELVKGLAHGDPSGAQQMAGSASGGSPA